VLLVAHFRDCLEQVQAIVQQGGFDNMIATTAENLTGRSAPRLGSDDSQTVVWLDEFAEQDALQPVLDRFNAAKHRLPWLDNRLLVLSFPAPTARAGP
jgi:hypothetical protein